MDKDLYLSRIGFEGRALPTLQCLEALSRAHLRTVPFENFDIHLGTRIRLDRPSLFRKIVRRCRGGFCYELNGLFAWLLREVGFRVDLLSSRVLRSSSIGADFDHMALRVWCDGMPYLVDVGFGDASTLPLPLGEGASRSLRSSTYRLHKRGDELLYEVEFSSGETKGYELSLVSHSIWDFAAMSRHHQSSPDSWFTNARICVLHTSTGTASLIDGRFKDGGHVVSSVRNDGDYLVMLRQRFGVDLPRLPSNLSERPLRKLRDRARGAALALTLVRPEGFGLW